MSKRELEPKTPSPKKQKTEASAEPLEYIWLSLDAYMGDMEIYASEEAGLQALQSTVEDYEDEIDSETGSHNFTKKKDGRYVAQIELIRMPVHY